MVAAWMWLGTHQTCWFIAMDEFHASNVRCLRCMNTIYGQCSSACVEHGWWLLFRFLVVFHFYNSLLRLVFGFALRCIASVYHLKRTRVCVCMCVARILLTFSHLSHKHIAFFYAHIHRAISLEAFVNSYMHFVFACLDKWWKRREKRTTEKNDRTNKMKEN